MSPRLISVARRPSDCSRFKSRLISEERIPGFAPINESTFSIWLPGRPGFAAFTDRLLPFAGERRVVLIFVLGPCGFRFIAISSSGTRPQKWHRHRAASPIPRLSDSKPPDQLIDPYRVKD